MLNQRPMNAMQVLESPRFQSHNKGMGKLLDFQQPRAKFAVVGMSGLGDQTSDDLAAMQPDVNALIYGGSPVGTSPLDMASEGSPASLVSNLGTALTQITPSFSFFSSTGLLLLAGGVIVFMLVTEKPSRR